MKKILLLLVLVGAMTSCGETPREHQERLTEDIEILGLRQIIIEDSMKVVVNYDVRKRAYVKSLDSLIRLFDGSESEFNKKYEIYSNSISSGRWSKPKKAYDKISDRRSLLLRQRLHVLETGPKYDELKTYEHRRIAKVIIVKQQKIESLEIEILTK